MKTAIIIAALTCNAPPNAPTEDANEVIQKLATARTTTTGGKKFTSFKVGDIHLPAWTWLTVDKPVKIPFRTPIIGPQTYVRNAPGFYSTERLPYALETQRAPGNKKNYNGNFNQHLHNFSVDCRNLSGGIKWGAAQFSELRNLSIHNVAAGRYALRVDTGSTGWAAQLEIKAHDLFTGFRSGNGVLVNQARSGRLTASVNAAKTALWLRQSYNIKATLRLEQCDHVILEASKGCNLAIDWDKPSSTPLIVRSGRGANTITITFRRAPKTLWYTIDGGQPQKIPHLTGMHQKDGETIQLTTHWSGKPRKLHVEWRNLHSKP